MGANRPFPSSLVPLFQSESKCETILLKMTLICMKMKLHAELIFIWKVSHLDSFWNSGTRELGNGLLTKIVFLKWYYDQNFTPWCFSVSHGIQCKNKKAVYRLQIPALVPEIFVKFENWVKHANEMTGDVIHSTQYYIEYTNRAFLANLLCRTLKLGRLMVLQETHLWL